MYHVQCFLAKMASRKVRRRLRHNASIKRDWVRRSLERLESRLVLTTWFVDADAVGANVGADWSSAFKDLQAALSVAAHGDEIWIADGTYKPTSLGDRTKSFVLPDGVSLYGGFAGHETAREERDPGANQVSLNGAITGAGGWSYHIVVVPAGRQVLLDGVVISHSSARGASDSRGGGLLNFGTADLHDVRFVSNFATEGGAIYNAGTLNMTGGRIDQSSAIRGGGIAAAAGSVTRLRDAVLFTVSAEEEGGGIAVADSPFGPTSQLEIVGTVITGYAETGGSLHVGRNAQVSIRNSTLASDAEVAPQWFTMSPVTVHNSLIAAPLRNQNSNASAAEVVGPIDSDSSYNFIRYAPELQSLNGQNGNQVGLTPTELDAGIRFGQYCGDTLPRCEDRIELSALSPVLDRGNPEFDSSSESPHLTTDVYGRLRTQDNDLDSVARIDIGAIESDAERFMVSTTVDENDGDYSDGDLSLREAIILSNARQGDDVILLPAGVYAFSIAPAAGDDEDFETQGLRGDLDISDSLGAANVIGAGAESTIIDARGLDRVFQLHNYNGELTLSKLTIRGGDATQAGQGFAVSGGGINANEGTLRIADVIIEDNRAGYAGGGLMIGEGTQFFMDRTTVRDNVAEFGGGIWFEEDSDSIIRDSLISGNRASEEGGGFRLREAVVDVFNSTLDRNWAGVYGGGAATASSVLRLHDSIVSNNFANERGGGIYPRGSLTLTSVRVTGNSTSAAGVGGGIYAGSPQIVDSTIEGNSAGSGGGIALAGALGTTMINTTIRNNVAVTKGGGLMIVDRATPISPTYSLGLESISVEGNTAAQGAGIYNGVNNGLRLTSSRITNNTATEQGGGAFNDGGHLRFDDSVVQENRIVNTGSEFFVEAYGAGLFNYARTANATLVVMSSNVSENSILIESNSDSGAGGAGIANIAKHAEVWPLATLTIDRSTISHNLAVAQGSANAPEKNEVEAGAVGGGIFSSAAWGTAEVSVHRSTIDANEVRAGARRGEEEGRAYGGGVYFHGEGSSKITIEASTISRNLALANPSQSGEADGGGVYVSAAGNATFTLRNATVSGNTAQGTSPLWNRVRGGGIRIHSQISAEISHSTIVNNRAISDTPESGSTEGGGAIFSFSSPAAMARVFSTIIAQNTAAEGLDASNRVNSLGYNLVGDGSGVTGFDGPADQVGTAGDSIDPRIGPLAFNGGPTHTHALLPASPAIDAGSPQFDPNAFTPHLATDQRGQARVQDGDGDSSARIDLGSYEFSPTFLLGDLNNDGIVGVADLAVLHQNFGATEATFAQGDLNTDGQVDRRDVAALASQFGNRLQQIAAPAAPEAIAVGVALRTEGDRQTDAPANNSTRSAGATRKRMIVAESVDQALAVTTRLTAKRITDSKARVRRT